MGRSSATSSSSSSSNIGETPFSSHQFDHYQYHHQSQYHQFKRDLSTDLQLGLSISASQQDILTNSSSATPTPREQYSSDWPASGMNDQPVPVIEGEGSDEYCVNNGNGNGNETTLYVKVYMEGHPIGRKLDVLAHHGYHDLITTLDHMFNTNILWGAEVDEENWEDFHVLTYEDEEGDWMMVGDVPWEMFLSAVKRLKITRACPC